MVLRGQRPVECPRRLAVPPRVQVAKKNDRSLQAGVIEQALYLEAARAIHERQVGGHDRERMRLIVELRRDRGPALEAADAQVQAEDARDRVPRQDRVSELSPLVDPGHDEGHAHVQARREPLERVGGCEGPEHLLQRDHVGVELLDHRRSPGRLEAISAGNARPAMHVIGRDGQLGSQGLGPCGWARRLDHGQVGHGRLEERALCHVEVPQPLEAGYPIALQGHDRR